MSQKIVKLESKLEQLASEKQALESKLKKANDEWSNAKTNEEEIRNQYADLNEKLQEYEDKLDGKDGKIVEM